MRQTFIAAFSGHALQQRKQAIELLGDGKLKPPGGRKLIKTDPDTNEED